MSEGGGTIRLGHVPILVLIHMLTNCVATPQQTVGIVGHAIS